MSTDVETTILADYEFVPAIPCEHPGHNVARTDRGYKGHVGEDAVWDYEALCPCTVVRRMVCDAFRLSVIATGIICPDCRSREPDVEVTFTPIPEVTP